MITYPQESLLTQIIDQASTQIFNPSQRLFQSTLNTRWTINHTHIIDPQESLLTQIIDQASTQIFNPSHRLFQSTLNTRWTINPKNPHNTHTNNLRSTIYVENNYGKKACNHNNPTNNPQSHT